jgi:hypothetical protein
VRLRLVVLICCLTVGLMACSGGGGGGSSSPSIVGTWELFESGGSSASGWTITFNSDGTGLIYVPAYGATVSGTWTVSGGTYYLYINGELVETGTWAVDGDVLTMCSGSNCNRYRRA